jgi:hypothetical protein
VGFLNVDAEKYCNPCSSYMPHCTVCSNGSLCMGCESTWSVKGDSTGCVCSNGYYLNSSICSSCDTTCKTCTGNLITNCLSCKNNTFYLDLSNKCTACMSPCITCNSSTICLSCISGYFLNATTNTC